MFIRKRCRNQRSLLSWRHRGRAGKGDGVNNQICVSSYSFGQLLGPIRLTMRNPEGKKTPVTWGQGEPSITLLELPTQIKAKLGLNAIEICQFHIPEKTPAYLAEL